MMRSRPVAFAALAATALVGILALSAYGGGEDEEEEEGGLEVGSEESSKEGGVKKLPGEAQQLYEIAVALGRRGDYDQGEKVMRKVLEITEKEFGATHPAVGEALGNVAMLCQAQQKTDEAEMLFRRALVIEMAAYGNESNQAGTVMSNLATVLEELGRFNDAEELFRKCLEIKKVFGKSNEVASAHCLLAGALKNNGLLEESESNYQQAVGILEAAYGHEHESISILNRTLSLFPKLKSLKAVEFVVEGVNMPKSDPSWSSVVTEKLELELVKAEPFTAHTELVNAEEMDGKAALVIRGESSFSDKVTRCQAAGAKLVIVMSSDEKHPDAVFQMGAPEGFESSLPAFMVSHTNGIALQKLHLNGEKSIELVPPN